MIDSVKKSEQFSKLKCVSKKTMTICVVVVCLIILFQINGHATIYKQTFKMEEADASTVTVDSSKYLIDSMKCKILDIDPFASPVQHFHWKEDYFQCTNRELLTYVTKNDNKVTLHINDKVLPFYSEQHISCCHSRIIRGSSGHMRDEKYKLSPCTYFDNNVTLGKHPTHVTCTTKENMEVLVYENTHAPVVITDEIREKMDIMYKETAFSVLIIGIDSVSRLNFIRSLSNSYKFLMDNKWISFEGYNKVADNTYPNVMAILTGDNQLSDNSCNCNEIFGLNECPIIWYDFQNLGYVTAYAEDETYLSTFNLNKAGFHTPPTDYYFRPYFLASETLKIKYQHGLKYCTGPETSGERVMNVAKDFATTFVNYPSFGLFWMNTFSHNTMNSVSMMDHKIRQFLQDITNEGILENTIVFFLSDHGSRFGAFRESSMGWLEERLPFLFVWVPHSFRHKYPQAYDNIKHNSHKLTNPYDLYMTLQHILELSGYDRPINSSSDCPKCKSLFKKIENERSCKDAGIVPHWCTCTDFTPIDKNHNIAKIAASFVVNELNNILKPKQKECAKYSLKKIIAASISADYALVVIETQPKALFEATTYYNSTLRTKFLLAGSISRIDKYKLHSFCVQKSPLAKYCYCKNS